MLEATKSMLHHIMHDVREPRKTVTWPEINNKATASFDPMVEDPKIICNSGLHGKLFYFFNEKTKCVLLTIYRRIFLRTLYISSISKPNFKPVVDDNSIDTQSILSSKPIFFWQSWSPWQLFWREESTRMEGKYRKGKTNREDQIPERTVRIKEPKKCQKRSIFDSKFSWSVLSWKTFGSNTLVETQARAWQL